MIIINSNLSTHHAPHTGFNELDNIDPKIKHSILIVIDRYLPKVDGVLKTVEEFVKRSKNEFEISILAPKFSTQTFHGIKPITLNLTKRIKVFDYPLAKFSLKNMRRVKKAVNKTDLVFLQEYGPSCIMALYYARKFNKKTVLYVHNTPWEFSSAYFNLSERIFSLLTAFAQFCMNKVDCIFIPYKEYKKQLRSYHVKTKVELTKLGVDITRFSPVKNKRAYKQIHDLPEQKTIVSYVGRFSKEKNLELLAEGFKKLDPKKYHLLLVGDGEEYIKDLFQSIPNKTITGFVGNVQSYLQASDIFVMPSRTETTSLATLEAMGCAVPVLATKVGFIKTYLRKGYNGEFIAKDSPTMLALKIEKLANNPSYYQKLSQNARNMVAYQFSWERSVKKMQKSIKSLIS